jgi:sucrose phosphorylase
VNPAFGTWYDIQPIAREFRLMVDAVINHISSQSAWFQSFLRGEEPYSSYFLTVDPETDLSAVVRPRDLPLLTAVETNKGTRHVWTTFSADQIDLNFSSPELLFEIIDLLLFYVRQGAQFIRLDAIAFLWKEIGTSSIHLPQTHQIVKFIRSIFNVVAPWVYIITETNVPHEENISYFGNGTDEAHMVYQFALPPLVLHSLQSGDASRLTEWASNLSPPSDQATFFNFTASHDGVGVRPARNILTDHQIQTLVERTQTGGGAVSYRSVGKSERQPYELNITYFDALAEPDEGETVTDRWIARFLVSQAIMLSMIGVPGIYFHSLFGSRNDTLGVERTGRARSINREKLAADDLEVALASSDSHQSKVYNGYAHLLRTRRSHPAFNPRAAQEVLDLSPHVFALIRRLDGKRVLCLHEVTGQSTQLIIQLNEPPTNTPRDLLTGETVLLPDCRLKPYQVRWIQLDPTESDENRPPSL